MSNIVNKVKDALHGDKHNTHSSAQEGTHNPHSSRPANTMDPRVDSDRDGSSTMSSTDRTVGFGSQGTSGQGTSGLRTAGHGEGGAFSASPGAREGTYGPHSSRMANAADPRVDSDFDGSHDLAAGRTAGGLGSHSGSGMTGTTDASGFSGTTGGLGSNTHSAGHHAGSGMTGMTGTQGAPAGAHGAHKSRMGNAMDPRVDSDRDGRGGIGTGPGPAPNTAGPHKSDMMNKMDPRIDSDLDGSETMGSRNRTYQQ